MRGDPESEAAATRCPVCATDLREGAGFCGHCGTRISTPGPSPVLSEGRVPGQQTSVLVHDLHSGDHLWRRFRPVLGFWFLLLGTSAAVGIYTVATNDTSPAPELAMTFVNAVFVLVFCREEWEQIAPLLARSGLTDRTWWQPFAALAFLGVFMTGYLAIFDWVGAEEHLYLEPFLDHGWPLWSAFVLISICPAIFEELAFRGFIMARLESIVKRNDALLLQAAMFSILHLSPLILFSHFVMGIVFGLLRRRTGSLYVPIAVHAVWNAFVLIGEAAKQGLL